MLRLASCHAAILKHFPPTSINSSAWSLKVVNARGEDFGLSIPSDIKQWRGDDFIAIATNQKSLGIAMDFADIADAAYELTLDGKAYTENALCVRQVMYQLKPDCYPTLDDFYTMIARNCKRSFIKKQLQEHR